MKLTLDSILKGMLNEDVDGTKVLDAIDNHYYVRIKYDDGKKGSPKSKKSRIIQPMAFGTTKAGFPVVRAFQLNGNSRRGAPNWKFFRLDRIVSWRPMKNKKFTQVPDERYGIYNRYGDKTMGVFMRNAKMAQDQDLTSLQAVKQASQSIANAPKMSVKNVKGPITATQQWKKNVYTSQPNSAKYAQFAKNVTDSGNKSQNYWADYDKALQQANQQGPIDNAKESDYDVSDVDYDDNNFIKNTNTRDYGK